MTFTKRNIDLYEEQELLEAGDSFDPEDYLPSFRPEDNIQVYEYDQIWFDELEE